MANRYDHHHLQHNSIHNQISIFLPMFCRLSIDDIKLNTTLRRTQPPSSGEPSSPKVSCMGQFKRSNSVIAYPTKPPPNRKKLISGKAPFPNIARNRAGKEIAPTKKSRRSNSKVTVNNPDLADVAEMDPPLPVVRRVAPAGGGREEVNLWRRRFSGAGGLKSLEIQNIHSPECKLQRPPTI